MKILIPTIIAAGLITSMAAAEKPDRNAETVMPKIEALNAESNYQEVTSILGKPDSDTGSGIHIYTFELSDGSALRVGTPDDKHISYIDRITTERLLPRKVARDAIKPRMKGVELYSWKEKEEWVFVLVDGTNRLKSAGEIRKTPNKLIGVEALKEAFSGLAEGEFVSWSHHVGGFKFPPKRIREEIVTSAKAAKVKLAS